MSNEYLYISNNEELTELPISDFAEPSKKLFKKTCNKPLNRFSDNYCRNEELVERVISDFAETSKKLFKKTYHKSHYRFSDDYDPSSFNKQNLIVKLHDLESSDQQESDFIKAIRDGNYEVIKQHIESGVNVNFLQFENGVSALMAASERGHYEITKILLQHDATVDLQREDGWTALMFASENGHCEVVKLLLESDARVDLQQEDGWSALMSASQNGHCEVVKLLLERGARVDLQQEDGWSALMCASKNGHCGVVKLLLESGARVDLQQEDGWSALMSASQNGHCEVVKLLIESGACVDLQQEDGWSALMSASKNGHYEVVKLLLDSGASVDLQQEDGWSALMSASKNGHCEVVKLLLERGARVDLQEEDGWFALMIASQNGHCEVMKLLLERGARVDLQNEDGWSALMIASQNGHCEVVKLLLERGAQVDLQRDSGWSALMSASENGHCEVAKLLLEGGAYADMQNMEGISALMIACSLGDFLTAKLLLDFDAQVNLSTVNELSCLHSAIESGNTKLVKLLLAKVPLVEVSLLTVAIIVGAQSEIIDLLLQTSENSVNEVLFKALQDAVVSQNYTGVNFLFHKCLSEIRKRFPLMSHPQYPGILYFGACYWSWSTSKKATVGADAMGISISVPEGTLREEDSTDLLIHPCFSGPFELPAGYEPASPAYLVQPSRAATIHKDVTVRMHHYADLQTEEDCEEMVFVSASSTPLDTQSGPVYRFKEVSGAKCVFRPKDPVGEITLRHFCFIKICRKRQGNNFYSARLYRNISKDVFSSLSAVFCSCLFHPKYIKLCDTRIRERYSAISSREGGLSVHTGQMVSNEITFEAIDSEGWEVTFDKEPTKISKELLLVSNKAGSDFPPMFQVYVHPSKLEKEANISPRLKITGLGEQDCHFQLVVPSHERSLSSTSASISSSSESFIQNNVDRRCDRNTDTSETSTSNTKSNTLSHRKVLTEIVSVAKEWRDLGISLDLNYHILQEIEANHIRDGVRRCLEGVIHSWLEGNGSKVSWSVLCEALRCELVGRPNLAADIESKYVLYID